MLVFLTGIKEGIQLSHGTLDTEHVRRAGSSAIQSFGLRETAFHPLTQWRKQGIPDDEIVSKMIDLEIEFWRLVSEG